LAGQACLASAGGWPATAPDPRIVGVFQFDARALAFLAAFLIASGAYELYRIYINRTSRDGVITDNRSTGLWRQWMLACIQFTFTIGDHVIFPAFSIGLTAYLAVLETLWLTTGTAN
jgi:hypothetical protein